MKKKISAVMAVLLLVSLIASPAFAANPNLIVNGDFEAGNTGFDSGYTYVADIFQNSLGPPMVYAIGTNPNFYHHAWTSFGDHPSGTGKMMIVNGTHVPTDPKALVWGQEVVLPEVLISEYILYAGQHWPIGKVLVKNEDGNICVKFVIDDQDAIDDGWLITEVHVAAGLVLSDIPQRNGNPVPGQFPVNVDLDPGVIQTDWYCIPLTFDIGDEIFVAAHAKIEHAEVGHMEAHNFSMVSGADTDLASGGDAWVSTVDPWGSVDTNVNALPCLETALYMWDAEVATGAYAASGGLVEFVQTFNVIGTPKTATLKIAADNAFAYWLNDGDEVRENLADDWMVRVAANDFTWGLGGTILDPYTSGWSQVYTYDVLGSVVSGENLFEVTGLNAKWNTTLWSVNPAMVIYKLCGTSEQYVIDEPYDDESGWGGEGNFPGRNWAKFITYTTKSPVVEYEFKMYAASSHPAAPAMLQVSFSIDGGPEEAVGVAVLTSTPGEWVEVKYTFSVGAAAKIYISIRDLQPAFHGDDFCIDDISLVLK